MKQVLNTFMVSIVLLPFFGCYTELATVEQSDSGYAYDSDTTAQNGSTAINNNYYLNDSYRQSRMRVSFNYYYPTYSSWIGSYYNSYFNDYSWGMNFRPSWYYDPFYTYYPGCMYPSPYYDPWYPYYPPVTYYPGYYHGYNPSIYSANPPNPGRTRDGGATRDPQTDGRSRPIPGPVNVPVATSSNPVQRPRVPDEGTTIGRPTIRGPEKPWWERVNNDRAANTPVEARPVEVTKGGRPTREETTVSTPPVIYRPAPNREDRPIDRNKPNQPTVNQGKTERQQEARPVERTRRGEVRYFPPAKSSMPKDEARPVERRRESSRPSYSPAPQSAPPQSAPARGGGNSAPSGGRKRD